MASEATSNPVQAVRAADRPVRVLLPTGFGINCEAETRYAFELAGAHVDALHFNDLAQQPQRLAHAQILVLAGGFSFGDHLGAGRALAERIRARLGATLGAFVADGGLVIGICNGFQTLTRLGILPGGTIGAATVALAENHHGAFYDGWVRLAATPSSRCVFTRGIEHLELPVRHGEGRLVMEPAVAQALWERGQIPLRYVDSAGTPADDFPANPNGSILSAAALCDRTGRIFGLMPHPEAFLYRENHPSWRRRGGGIHGDGLVFFQNAVVAARGI